MRRRINNIALLFTAVTLCLGGCRNASEGTVSLTDTYTSAESSAEAALSETAASSETTVASSAAESISAATEITTEITAATTAVSEAAASESSSETLSETSQTELLTTITTTAATEIIIEETDPPKTSQTKPPAQIILPDIDAGSFTGEKVLENETACVDYSDSAKGVIKITYSGSCGKVKVRITKDNVIYDYNLDPSGTVFPLQSGSGSYNVKVLENVSGKTYAVALDMSFETQIKNELIPYLMPSQYISYKNGDNCVYEAARLCAGLDSDIDKAAAIFGHITSSITYDKELAASVKSGYIPSPDATLAKGSGICFDYASLFAAMCRSQNIPTRLVMGYVQGNIYHAWNEIYLEETGWITVDLFLDSKGWNLVDPTFYASAADKNEVSQYIGSGSDYSSVYYY